MKNLLVLVLLASSNAIAGGYYYQAPVNPQPLQYVLPPAYAAPPLPYHYYNPPPVYIPPPAPNVIRGTPPPAFVPFDTGRVVPMQRLEGFK
jgi:hypothetical protein